ncbi:phosphoglycerate mutase-like protein [Hypoxylon trugodes]|uniref:phosphoglycerate mutase-like protein n=1 Tax=Hypoxylon trugodes TaxID=326681 RepID=UPI00219CBCAC|nr:phosphoglycerate mutase-like protein [Hypoxylon trugodes]KAI1388377.1 phosphoglycerate mutase-like protein [Hypoxylon trugodes]
MAASSNPPSDTPSGPIIDIIRHGQSLHSVEQAGTKLHDPGLTQAGIQDCKTLGEKYPFADKVTDIFCSPLRRAIESAIYTFRPIVKDNLELVLLPELQEINDTPSSTGSPNEEIQKWCREFGVGDNVDMSQLDENWQEKGPDSLYCPHPKEVERRALDVREWLRDAAKDEYEKGNHDAHIVVVTHGEFAHWLTGDFAGVSYYRNSGWACTELRSYRFEDLESERHGNAPLKETQESRDARRAGDAGTNKRENELIKRVATIRVQEYNREMHRRIQRKEDQKTNQQEARRGEWVDELQVDPDEDEVDGYTSSLREEPMYMEIVQNPRPRKRPRI